MIEDLLSISARDDSGMAILEVSGEVDLFTAPTLERALKDTLAECPSTLALDLQNVTYMDAQGLVGILRARKALHSWKGDLWVIIPCSGFIPKLLSITGVSAILKLGNTLEEVKEKMAEEKSKDRIP